jgi:FAD/FMN-containing dehydrogenase
MQDVFSSLKEVIRGEVLMDSASRNHYAKDGSIFKVEPAAVFLPKDATDIAALVRWLKARKEQDPENPAFSVTCRGKATDQAGGPLNKGIIVRFPGHLDKVLEVGQNFVRLEPGVIVGKVNELLAQHGRFLPFYPASQNFSTIGGAVANNAAGEKTLKYGSARLYIKALKMVLASGAEVTVMPLARQDLELKKQQLNLEGDIYRGVETLMKKHRDLIEASRPKVNKYATGYNLWDVERMTDEGIVFDLTQLIAGSQGTLGILTEISLWTLPLARHTGVLLAYFDSLSKAGEATLKLEGLDPSAIEMVDKFLLEIVNREKPEMLAGLLPEQAPEIALLCEFEGDDVSVIEERLRLAEEAVAGLSYSSRRATDSEEQKRLWQVRRSALVVIEEIPGRKKALPFIEDVTVPPEKFPEYLAKLYEILKRHSVEFAVWGHAGNGNLHVQPFLDIVDPVDREKLFAIADEVFNLAAKLEGVFSGEHNDGIMRTPYLSRLYPKELLDVWREVKKIFDPQNIFNPGKKVAIDLEYAKSHLRDEYDVGPSTSSGHGPPPKGGGAAQPK